MTMVHTDLRGIEEYAVYVVDMDGTLYFKRPMQIKMALRLMVYYGLRLYKVKELLILADYRKLRDLEELSDREDAEQIITSRLCEKYGYTPKRTRAVIEEWILRRPLDTLRQCADRKLSDFLDRVRAEGKKVFIYSDYPAADKCAALGLHADGIYWPDGKNIQVLKPAPQGLRYLIMENSLQTTDILFIGDRMEKDGECAKACGVDHLILKKKKSARTAQYRRIFGE